MTWTKTEPRMDAEMRQAIEQLIEVTSAGTWDLPMPYEQAINRLIEAYMRAAEDPQTKLTSAIVHCPMDGHEVQGDCFNRERADYCSACGKGYETPTDRLAESIDALKRAIEANTAALDRAAIAATGTVTYSYPPEQYPSGSGPYGV